MPTFACSITTHVGEALAHELERPVGRAVVDHDRLVAAHRLEAPLDPRQPVVRDDDDRDVSHRARARGRRTPSQQMIRKPGQRQHERHHEEEEAARERAVGVDAELAEEADEERLAHGEAVDRERDRASRGRAAARARCTAGSRGRSRPRCADAQIAAIRESCSEQRHGRDEEQRAAVVAVAVDALVDERARPARPAAAGAAAPRSAARGARGARRTRRRRSASARRTAARSRGTRRCRSRPTRARARRRRAAASPRRRSRARAAPSRRSASRSRDGASSSRRCARRRRRPPSAAPGPTAYETKYARVSQRERLEHAAHLQQQLPAPGLRRHGHHGEEGREREPGEAGVAKDLDARADVDLRDDVGDRERGHASVAPTRNERLLSKPRSALGAEASPQLRLTAQSRV